MGENTEMIFQHNPKDRLQDEIRHTESEISRTVHTIESRLSPKNLKRQATLRAKQYVFKSLASVIDLVQRRPVPIAAAAAGGIWLMLRKKKVSREKAATGAALAGTAAKAFLSGAAGKAAKHTSATGTSIMWRGLATALGAAASTFWHRRKQSQSLTPTTRIDIARAEAFAAPRSYSRQTGH